MSLTLIGEIIQVVYCNHVVVSNLLKIGQKSASKIQITEVEIEWIQEGWTKYFNKYKPVQSETSKRQQNQKPVKHQMAIIGISSVKF